MPAELRSWLLLATSMTEALGHASGSAVRLTRLRDGIGRARMDECRLLDRANARARVREVVLSGTGGPLMAARTVYLSRRLHADAQLTSLRERPLGTLLFRRGTASVCRREFAMIDARSPLYRLARRAAGRLRRQFPARRTVYRYRRQPLLVTEIFVSPICRRQSAPTGDAD
jgi:chorismate-pyruvate lyase